VYVRKVDAGPDSGSIDCQGCPRHNGIRGCLAAALAAIRNAELVIGDHDFKAVEGEIKIAWLN
jgi:hypothetical protein